MRIQLLITCLIDSLFPEIGEAVVEVLVKAGTQVAFPPAQTCCGQPAMNAGFGAEAARMARHTIAALGQDPSPVVVPSGSCTAMIRHGYPELFAQDKLWSARARELAANTFEFSEFLVDQLRVADLGATTAQVLAYHPSCHTLRELGVDRQPMTLLEAVSGPSTERLDTECCGFGGVFSILQQETSQEMLLRTQSRIENSGAETVVGCDVSCLLQIEGGLRAAGSSVRCAHLAQVLASRKPGLR